MYKIFSIKVINSLNNFVITLMWLFMLVPIIIARVVLIPVFIALALIKKKSFFKLISIGILYPLSDIWIKSTDNQFSTNKGVVQ